MNTNIVSKIISRIQFTIYSLLAFLVFIIILSYALLSYGISIPRISLPNFKIEQLYIKLDKKLSLQIKQIDVSLSNNNSNDFFLLKIPKLLPIIDFARDNFDSFKIDTLNIDKQKVTFSYNFNSEVPIDNCLTVCNQDINASLYFNFYDEFLALEMEGIRHKATGLSLSSRTILDFNTNITYSSSELASPDKTKINVYTKGNGNALIFTASSTAFTDLSSAIAPFNLSKGLKKWIVDYNQAKTYQIVEAKGLYQYDNPQSIIDTLFLHAHETDLNYTFKQDLFPISTPFTDVYFAQNILTIDPHSASYNKHLLDDASLVKIDFNGQEAILKLDLKLNTTIDTDIVSIVNAYDIPLPLLQENGSTQARIIIDINLAKAKASATGQFFIKDSDLILNDVRYKLKNASARLHKRILSIDNTYLEYKDILKATLNGQMDLTSLTGDFFFDIEDITLGFAKGSAFKLHDKNKRLHLSFDKNTQQYHVPSAQWKFNDQSIFMHKNTFVSPVKFDSEIHVKNLKLNIENIANAELNGTIDIPRASTILDMNLNNISYHNEDLNITSDTDVHTTLSYDNNKTDIKTHALNTVKINNASLDIFPTTMQVYNGYLDLNATRLKLNQELLSQVSTHYELGEKNIDLTLQNTMLSDAELLFITKPIVLSYLQDKSGHTLDIKSLDLKAHYSDEKTLELRVNDFSKLYPYSKTQQIYDIKEGSAKFTFLENNIGMDLQFINFIPLLAKNGKNITTYNVKGHYQNDIAQVRINKEIDFIYYKKGKFLAKNIDFNLFPIKNYIQLINTKNEKSNLDLYIQTKNCNVRLGDSGRKILADSIKIKINDDKIDAQLIHNKGTVLFQSENDDFTMYGHKLNDKFLNEIVKFSTFKNGTLSLAIQGSYQNFKGTFKVDDTIIKDYTVLNNTLAFFNTIPSLVTFSVPGYSKNGLKVDDMYTNFEVNESILHLKDTKISSKELTITAKGSSDLNKETIDMLMEVKTDLGSSAKNIPLIGYLIFGEDTVSTTVRVHGDLKNPKVENSLAKSVIVAPFNIIKRTLTLPFLPFMDDEDDSDNTKKDN